MKKLNYSIIIAFTLVLGISCSDDFLDTKPTGSAPFETLATNAGANAALIGAYHGLLGAGQQAGGWFGSWSWAAAPTNWVWGSVASDDATKGSDIGDQSSIVPVENYSVDAANGYVSDKWNANFDGVARCNDVLRLLAAAKDVNEAAGIQIKAQALFLRGWFHFELKRVYNNIPYITENDLDPSKVPNNVDTWPLIAADLQFAVDNLLPKQGDVGRATKFAAEAVLARVSLFRKDYAKAKALLQDIIDNGGYSLTPKYTDNYMIATRNNPESIFEIQYAVNDGTPESVNGGYGDALNFPIDVDGTGTCCGFHQPTQNLVNAFKVDANGLPLIDTYNDVNLKNDMGLSSSDVFVQDTVTLVDPRLDLSIGRRGLPYLDWGIMRGKDWVRDQANAGPYLNKKNMFKKSEKGSFSTTTGWATGVNSNNYRAYRYAHVLLWRAEVAVYDGDLELARTLINQVRERASHETLKGRTRTFELPKGVAPKVDYTMDAANYKIGQYTTPFANATSALKAVQMELRLEFAMEGHRFFDLVRWGIADQVLNAYIEKDKLFRSLLGGTKPAVFVKGKNEYWPIPTTQMDLQKGVLTQNPQY